MARVVRWQTIALVSVGVMLGLAAATAGAVKRPQLKVGDRVDVQGSPVRCVAGRQARKRLISCFLVGPKGPVPGSVAIAITGAGTVKVIKFGRKGHAALVF